MVKRMLIDATHPEETRVVVINGTRLEELDIEISSKKQLKGNVYLAKIIRVEPSLQAAFVDYGGNRHGFLAFSEIHPDYYQIAESDRQKLMAEQRRADAEIGDGEDGSGVDAFGGEDADEGENRHRARSGREYKIQEVIKRRQIILVQVAKEERGNKGAALTTYLSLAGRYCVLMPNSARGGGVSRKIVNLVDRRRLKSLLNSLKVPEGMGVILRTAGAERAKVEIRRDYEYLMRTWSNIRDIVMASRAPALTHEEANLIKRSIRDIYSRDIDEIIVDGEEGYRLAKDFMKTLTPSHAKKVQRYRNEGVPLFQRYQVAAQLDAMHNPVVQLKAGGYTVFNQTEALVAIDVNSGKATKERHIEETALKTNLEAADEIARQLRLRDLAGLIVIDFIDMEDSRNNAAVERRLKDALRSDRARIQMGRISSFGLLELSRQRLRPSLMETSFETCVHCGGTGLVRSVESSAMHVLRAIEEEGLRRRSSEVTVSVPTVIAFYILNQKRTVLAEIEASHGLQVVVNGNDTLIPPNFLMDRVKSSRDNGECDVEALPPVAVYLPEPDDEDDSPEVAVIEKQAAESLVGVVAESAVVSAEDGDPKRRRRRRRRGGKRGPGAGEGVTEEPSGIEAAINDTDVGVADGESAEDDGGADAEEPGTEDTTRRTSRRRGKRGGRKRRRGGSDVITDVVAEAEESDSAEEIPVIESVVEDEALEPARKRPTTRRKKIADDVAPDVVMSDEMEPTKTMVDEPKVDVVAEPVPAEPERPRRSGWWQKAESA